MIQSQAGTKTSSNGSLKQYIVAVLVGIMLGGAYAVTEQPAESQAQTPLLKRRAAQQTNIAKSLRVNDDCGARIYIDPASVVVARPMLIYEEAVGHYVEVGSDDIREAVCTWAI